MDPTRRYSSQTRETKTQIQSTCEPPSWSQYLHRQPMCRRRWYGNCGNCLGVCSSWYWSHPSSRWHGRPGPSDAPLERTHGRWVFFHSEARKSQKTTALIRDLVTKAGNLAVSNLLFVHAWSGCDTTSATFGQGKTTLLKKIKASKEIQAISSAMCNPNASGSITGRDRSSWPAIVRYTVRYDGKQHESLNGLRYAKHIKTFGILTHPKQLHAMHCTTLYLTPHYNDQKLDSCDVKISKNKRNIAWITPPF